MPLSKSATVENAAARAFYEIEAARGMVGRELERQITSLLEKAPRC